MIDRNGQEGFVAGVRRLLCVHRKGATRALPPRHPDLPEDLRTAGQPASSLLKCA